MFPILFQLVTLLALPAIVAAVPVSSPSTDIAAISSTADATHLASYTATASDSAPTPTSIAFNTVNAKVEFTSDTVKRFTWQEDAESATTDLFHFALENAQGTDARRAGKPKPKLVIKSFVKFATKETFDFTATVTGWPGKTGRGWAWMKRKFTGTLTLKPRDECSQCGSVHEGYRIRFGVLYDESKNKLVTVVDDRVVPDHNAVGMENNDVPLLSLPPPAVLASSKDSEGPATAPRIPRLDLPEPALFSPSEVSLLASGKSQQRKTVKFSGMEKGESSRTGGDGLPAGGKKRKSERKKAVKVESSVGQEDDSMKAADSIMSKGKGKDPVA
ncbi:hypothetical protein F5878DRAFT_52188 [Lentinula raphanica]|uniref:Uncharacterized protein n=1 Tax=Lentinula raphanica TaxID=153919 RepID=A0AA38UGN3_9AGAR|nr:hypothetical protein F5878DRAFT_52188 [Lentinula raphanica]